MGTAQAKSGGVNREHGRTLSQKLVFSLGHLAVVVVSAWLVFGGAWTSLGQLLGREYN